MIVNITLSQLCDPRIGAHFLLLAGSELQTPLSYMAGRPHFSHILTAVTFPAVRLVPNYTEG